MALPTLYLVYLCIDTNVTMLYVLVHDHLCAHIKLNWSSKHRRKWGETFYHASEDRNWICIETRLHNYPFYINVINWIEFVWHYHDMLIWRKLLSYITTSHLLITRWSSFPVKHLVHNVLVIFCGII
jgi:hypothetical protein